MKLITIKLTTVWIFLHGTCQLVSGGGLRGPSSSSVATFDPTPNNCRFEYDERKHRRTQEVGGQDSVMSTIVPDDILPPPEVHLQVGNDTMVETEDSVGINGSTMAVAETFEEDSLVVAPICTGTYEAEVWIGSQPLDPTLKNFDVAKLWVISSDATDHTKPGIPWKTLDFDQVPKGYKGDKLCAKFFTIGAEATATKELKGGVNHPTDVNFSNFLNAVFVQSPPDVAILYSKVVEANAYMNGNFGKTDLKYVVLPWGWDTYNRPIWWTQGFGWNEFNSNGYISGLMSLLEMPLKKPYGRNLPGWKTPVPKGLFQQEYDTTSKVQKVIYDTQKCPVGTSELWIGYHHVQVGLNWYEHAKIWVISSDPIQHAKLEVPWQDLSRDRVPFGFSGGVDCAKFFSVGADAGVWADKYNLVGGVNRGSDVKQRLYGARLVKKDVDPVELLQQIDDANRIMNENFRNTALKRDTPFPRDWNNWGFGWNEFNSNGYISGLLHFLNFASSRPNYSRSMPGWYKSVPDAIFEKIFTSDEEVKSIIFGLHKAPYMNAITDFSVEGDDEETHEQLPSP